ncbi:hypothetical protein [Candidatus Laterigemmans baculatus]|uniref:hypothetical protein n=1 Tax=Candidatus Laterigemmans baculatus TaxID=2770505 RepID=UPI0013DD3459|nr:hypothetical protein [Candidatus Laterigemmans baculatus]
MLKDLGTYARVGCLACLAFVALGIAPAPVAAEIVFQSNATYDDAYPFSLPLISDSSAKRQAGDRFSLTSSTSLHSVDWWGVDGSSGSTDPQDFTIEIYRATALGPGDRLFQENVSVASPVASADYPNQANIYSYSAAITETQLAEGSYYLSIFNRTSTATPNWSWMAVARTGGMAHTYDYVTYEWNKVTFGPGATTAFALRGVTAVPEPASLATLAFCLTLGASGAGRLWKKRQTAVSGQLP